ncbi:MAG TPA: helix-turn-helix domain-containing protein [Candidatus Limnocylindrales bacterium]
MGDLLRHLARRVDHNARRAVDTYHRELADFRALDVTGAAATTMLDFAVALRRRTVELAANDEPFTDDDLHFMTSVGRERAERGILLESERKVQALHAALTLQEVREAAGPGDIDDLMHMLRWIGVNGVHAQNAYTRGFLAGQRGSEPYSRRIQRLAEMLIRDDAAAPQLAAQLGVVVPGWHCVTVVHFREMPHRSTDKLRTATLEALLGTHRYPMMWRNQDEFLLLTPAMDVTTPFGPEDSATTSVVADLCAELRGPCSIGLAVGRTGHLGEAAALACRISRVAPAQSKPRELHTVADVIVELALGELPELDRWLRSIGELLAAGPDLVRTLNAFYQHDMNRLRAANALNIHPRTLDYRIHRARDLTGLHPASTRGVRVISAAVAHALRHNDTS